MAKIDKADMSCARVKQYTASDVSKAERHNERKNETYENMNVIVERIPFNVHFKKPTAPTYMEQLKQMETDGQVSLRGLRKDATLFNEIVIDVNTMYFERKTNILELINICFAIGKFAETDFMDITLPIKIKFKVKYSNEEIGYFEDNFDVDDSNSITLVAMQDSVDERINYYHDTPNQTKISMATIRTMNILYYYAQRMPSKEVDFRKTSGSGKVLNYLIQHSLEQSEIQVKDILKKTKLKSIV